MVLVEWTDPDLTAVPADDYTSIPANEALNNLNEDG